MKTVKLCMIGAGRHSSNNMYPNFSKLENAIVVANADIDFERARKIGIAYGVEHSYDDYHKMLEAEKPDAVLVCVGPDFHTDTAVELLDMGYHVYTEKPPAVNAARAKEILHAQKRSGKICQTGFKKRYAPCYQQTKDIIESNRFGSPCILSMLRTSGPCGNTDDPLSQYILDSGIHVIDLATYLFGRVRTVYATKQEPASYAISLMYENGAVGTLTLTDRVSHSRAWEDVTVIGTGGVCIQLDNSVEMIAFEKGVPFAAHKPNFVAGLSDSMTELGFLGELQEFVNAILSNSTPVACIEDSVHTMELIDAIKESSSTDKVIVIS